MSDSIVNPRKNRGEPELPPVGILAVNPADTPCFAGLAGRFGLTRHTLFHAQLLSNTTFFLAGPAVGAPMAAICLEKLIVLGARRVLVYGWCGSIHPLLQAGDLFVPTGGLSEEGTSGHYQTAAGEGERDIWPQGLVAQLNKAGYSPRLGQVWTTDAVYRETREKVELYRSQGILAVDMEYTALRSVAAFRRIRLAALMLVSDELYHREWSPRLQFKQFRARSRRLLEQLCAIIHAGEDV